ncbi:hypothetical protein niasHS_005042 [Heterodera schachtii]|uniref:B30.2/SPRY domain-containing protein n=1 Tax=Heterodera schachtii TaxID=97005 RepID=A0ABD2JKC5_HETSC
MDKAQIVAIAVMLFVTVFAMDILLMANAQCAYNPSLNGCEDPQKLCAAVYLYDGSNCFCDFKIKMSSFTTFSPADEFSPLQPIFPNLSTSEEMSVLIARIAELYRAKTIEPSVASSAEVFGQDGYGINDEELSLDEEDEDEQQEDRKTPTKDVSEDHLKAILERIGEIEKQQQQQTKAAEERFLHLQNDQKKILEKISVFEKQTQKKVFLKFEENCWDAFACHKDIEITGDKSLTVHHKGISGCCGVSFGLAVKHKTPLDKTISNRIGTYAFNSYGVVRINGEFNQTKREYSYGAGDTVGIGVNLATRQIIFTKNGKRLGFSDLFVSASFTDDSVCPFVSLLYSGNKIEANFGPNFKFDLSTL